MDAVVDHFGWCTAAAWLQDAATGLTQQQRVVDVDAVFQNFLIEDVQSKAMAIRLVTLNLEWLIAFEKSTCRWLREHR